VWRLLYPRAARLGVLKKKGKKKNQDADWRHCKRSRSQQPIEI